MTYAATPEGASPTRDLTCPSCGRTVPARVEDLRRISSREGGGLVTAEQLAHALCGCYVLDMSSSGLARLMGGIFGS